jgi:hypothetical protein
VRRFRCRLPRLAVDLVRQAPSVGLVKGLAGLQQVAGLLEGGGQASSLGRG